MDKNKIKKQKHNELELTKAQLLRSLADYDNLKKRIESEKAEFYEIAKARLVSGLLPIFDMLEQVQKHVGDSGLAIALKELEEKLREEGIEAIEPKKGDKFDEHKMEATEAVESKEVKDGEVVEMNLKGYKIGDRILRYAKVVVNRKEKKNE